MRQVLLFFCLFAAPFLLAQSKTSAYSQKQYEQPQKAEPVDCYVRKFDAGTSAFRRGDYRTALRLFEEAKTCPDARTNARRTNELDDKIEHCNFQLGKKTTLATEKTNTRRQGESIELTGRKFTTSAAFARNTDPNCFQITMREADRAFRDSCWDDAAKLYRAAKSCADANQTDRERMSNRIVDCEEAAKDELLQKEQKALRIARHALAANSADDAMDLLREGNRSLAWRLADFANYYIAPDDNPDCLEAMYAAYFYAQPVGDSARIRPPFCYQIAVDLAPDVQYKFYENEFGEFLIAFLPKECRSLTWELPSMKIVQSYSGEILKDAIGFDLAPNGGMMIYGANYFYLPNGQTYEVPGVTNYCFSEDSEFFFYEDIETGIIHTINMELPSRVQQQRKINNNLARYNPQPAPIQLESNLLSMQIHNGEFWLGYADRVEVLARKKGAGNFTTRMTWYFADSDIATSDIQAMFMYPGSQEVILSTANESYYYSLSLPPDDSVQATVKVSNKLEGHLLACSQGTAPLLMVTSAYDKGSWQEILTVQAPATAAVKNCFYTHGGLAATFSANISKNGRWILSKDANGRNNLWSLQDLGTTPPIGFASEYDDCLSPDGNLLFSKDKNLLKVFDIDDMAGGAQQEYQTLPDAPLPEGDANQWAVFRSKESTISIENFRTKQAFHFDVNLMEYSRIPYTFDPSEERYFAYSPSNGVVAVKFLNPSIACPTHDFGGIVTQLKSIPGTDKLLVITRSELFTTDRYTVRVWDFSKPEENPRVVRLQDYNVQFARVSDQGDRIALSNSNDIRLFSLENLDNELVVINPSNGKMIYDIAFRPDGLALVSGDDGGNVSIWDITTGKALLHFSNVWAGEKRSVDRLAFAYNGTRLRMLSSGQIFTTDLDAYAVRDLLQSNDRWLTSFTSEQIRAYNLEIAFKFPGNFDRLADSDDFPLILSFFNYFRDQSINSNNIDLVRTYCDRAKDLYELLDAKGQGNIVPTILEMYEDYILKLLLRNNPEAASSVVKYLETRFNKPDVAVLDGAHTALLQHDTEKASQQYTNYLLLKSSDPYFNYQLNDINAKLSQFQEYDLLDSTQIQCICSVFHPFNTFEKLCPPGKKYLSTPFATQIEAYYQIYSSLDSIAYATNKTKKVQVLEKILALASTLPYPNTISKIARHPLDTIAIVLASAYVSLGDFEQNSPKTPFYYQKAIDLLERTNATTNQPDTAKLNRLLVAHSALGQYYLDIDKPAEAVVQISAALGIGSKLNALYGEGTLAEKMMGTRVLSPVYIELCKARLLEGKPAEARVAFEQANDLLTTKLQSALLGHAALLENNEIEAFLEYGNMTNSDNLVETLVLIERMADLHREYRARMLAFEPRLKNAFLSNHPEIKKEELDYTFAIFQMNRNAARSFWDSALVWSTIATKSIEKMMASPEKAAIWQENWVSQRINQAYYLLMAKHGDTSALSEVIRYSNEVIHWMAEKDPYSFYKSYVFTNLGHAYLLRNAPGDREKAIESYSAHLNTYNYITDTWEQLIKDFRDLHRVGVIWPDLRGLIQIIKPEGAEVSPEEWREMGEP